MRRRRPSAGRHGTTRADRVPRPAVRLITTVADVRRPAIASRIRRSSAPRWSILLMKNSVGTRSRRRARSRTRVCGWTPSTAEITRTAPSSTSSTRSTSAMKSGWPGVSIRLTSVPRAANDATAERIVMPR
jgi:hypothetical protein